DDPQNLAGGGLLLQRLGQLAVAPLQFLEQPHVFDSNDGLVGEGFQQCDLRVGKRSRLRSANGDRPVRPPVTPPRRPDGTAPPASGLYCLRYGLVVLGICQGVWYVDNGALEDGAAERQCPTRRSGKEPLHRLNTRKPDVRMCGQMHEFTVVPRDSAVVSVP